jgi:hypothetical protein
LGAADTEQRRTDWDDVLRHVRERHATPSGVRLEFHDTAPVDAIAALAVAEQECCAFFAFTLTIDRRGVALEVNAPATASVILQDVFGGGR